MARFLVAWELGGDLGHLRRVIPVGRALREGGHEVAFAFRDATCLGFAADAGFPAWPAPMLRVPERMAAAPLNIPDMLLNIGFRDRASVSGVQRAWDALMAAAAPDVVVADYAPNALIAAARHGVRRATLASGFALPPIRDPMPALRPGTQVDEQALRSRGAELQAALDAALAGTRHPGAGERAISLDTLFYGDVNVLATLPQLDPFGPREGDYVGPVLADDGGVEAQWKTDAPRVLAYLKPRDARFAPLLEAMRASGVEALVAAPGLAPEAAHRASDERVRVVPAALRLAPLLAQADLCVSHAGPGFAAAALLAGVPLALAPMHAEQDLIALRLQEQGLAIVLDAREGAQGLRAGLTRALSDDAMRQRARAIAASVPRTAGDAARAAADRLARLAG
jgi:UDP:flavonoid glycosyltransferase YjiC (YdhE family)